MISWVESLTYNTQCSSLQVPYLIPITHPAHSPPTSHHQPSVYSLLLRVSYSFFPSLALSLSPFSHMFICFVSLIPHEWNHMVFVFLWLISLSIIHLLSSICLVVLICIFLRTSDVEHLTLYVVIIHFYILLKELIIYFAHFYIGLSFHYCKSSIYILTTDPLSGIWFSNILFITLPFHFCLMVTFEA